ncbi:thiol-activated cytolysin family protein [Lacibacter sp. H407]|uniref:thiol-activated cytolysin family protein n=1 Tax=Lacibacter sp. H407 TaxID=3133423 RepID=UPI0030BBD6BF
MKQTLFILLLCCTASICKAQRTPVQGTRTQTLSKSNILNNKLTNLAPPARREEYKGLFNPGPVTRNVGGVNVTSTAVVNNVNSDNMSIRPVPNSVQKTTENGFECTTSREYVTADSKSFLSVTANGDGIYPGAIYTYADYMNGNFLREVGVGKRNPIQIFTNNLANSTGDVSVTVPNPTSVNITNAIAGLVRNNSVTNVAASQIGQYIYSQNQAGLLLSISGGGAYSGFAASAGFTLNKQSNHIYLTCDFKIPLYTLYTNFPQTGFLNDANLEHTPNLVLVNSVTYGTRVLVNIDIDESTLSTELASKFKYGDPNSAGFNVDLKFLMDNKSVKCVVNSYVVGARPQNLGNPTTVDQVFSFVDGCIRNTNYQTAKPITYTLSTMGGELVGIKSSTDEYLVKNCVPKKSQLYISDVSVNVFTKGNYKESGSNASFTLYANNGNVVVASSPNNNGQMGPSIDNTVGLSPTGRFLVSDLQLGRNFLEIVLDRPNCVFTCDDWEIDNVMITINTKDENNVVVRGRPIQICSSAFVLQKGKRLRLEFDGNLKPLSQNLF